MWFRVRRLNAIEQEELGIAVQVFVLVAVAE
jgi:hypothetical protein